MWHVLTIVVPKTNKSNFQTNNNKFSNNCWKLFKIYYSNYKEREENIYRITYNLLLITLHGAFKIK